MSPRRPHLGLPWIALADIVFLTIAAIASVCIRFRGEVLVGYNFWHLQGWFVLFGGVLLGNYLGGSYSLQHNYSRFNTVLQLVFALAVATALVGILSYTWLTTALGRGLVAMTLLGYSVPSLLFKFYWYGRLSRRAQLVIRVAVLGCGKTARNLVAAIENPHVIPRHEVVAFLCPTGMRCSEAVSRPLQEVSETTIVDTLKRLNVHVLVTDDLDHRMLAPFLLAVKPLRYDGLQLLTALRAMERYSGRIPLHFVDDLFPLLDAVETDLLLFGRIKRIGDVLMSLLGGLLIMAPGLILVAMIKMSAPRLPVFYSQTRVGRFGHPFRIYKFRSMQADAESATGAVWSGADDPRVTRLGRFMRRFRIDELPQLWNILKGDMSVVGPRPERPELVDRVGRHVPYFNHRLDVPPGLTGWAQVRYPYGESIADAARKLEYDLYYIKNMSPLLDLRIMLSTLRIVVFGIER